MANFFDREAAIMNRVNKQQNDTTKKPKGKKKKKVLDNSVPLFLTNPPPTNIDTPTEEEMVTETPSTEEETETQKTQETTAKAPPTSNNNLTGKPEQKPKEDNSQILGFAFSQFAPLLIGAAMEGSEGAASAYDSAQNQLDVLRQQGNVEADRALKAEQAEADREAAMLRQDRRLEAQEEMLDKRLSSQERMLKQKQETANAIPSYRERLESLGGEEKKRFDGVTMGLRAIADLENVSKQTGFDRTERVEMIGDNPYTFAKTRFAEAIGRLQSGGAISEKEEERFLSLVPGPLDDEQIARKKLKTMREDLESRLATLGFKPGEVGLSPGPSVDKERLRELLIERGIN